MLDEKTFPGMKPGDVFVTLDDSELGKGEMPLQKEMYLKTEAGRKDLDGSSLLYGAALPSCPRTGRCMR